MRLIDADAIINNLGSGKGTAIDNVRKIIESEPTAYDVDKVVEQLDNLREEYADQFYDYDPEYFIDKAIEIVKAV